MPGQNSGEDRPKPSSDDLAPPGGGGSAACNWTVEVEALEETDYQFDTESRTIDGELNPGETTSYMLGSDPWLNHIDLHGGRVRFHTYSWPADCDESEVIMYPPPTARIKIEYGGAGGEYTIGYWPQNTLSQGRTEKDELSVCYPHATDTGDAAIVCEYDIEGVTTGTVNGDTYDFATGQIDSPSDMDVYTTGKYGGAPLYLELSGGVTVLLSKA